MQFTDPIAFEQFLAPAGGEVRIRPAEGSHFRANIDMRRLPRAGLFAIEGDSFAAQKRPEQDFYGITIPLNVPFSVTQPGHVKTYGHANAHMLSPGNPFNLKCRNKCHFLACSIFVESLAAYKESTLQETSASFKLLAPHVSLMSPGGSRLFRSVVRTWVALTTEDSQVSESALIEMEDDILARFLLLAEATQPAGRETALPADYTLRHVEDYICANLDKAIIRDDLANVAGVSIRSLSRAFKKKYGMGPMAFVRQRRLDDCFSRLRGARPGTITVTDVAMSHGFSHVGKFAIAYKQAFGESPSTSLLK
jgi:AraC-like DNA-binding protein